MVALAVALLMGADTAPIKLVKQFTKKELPFERINGISISGKKWIVGGMRGLYVGSPESGWKAINDQSIRQVVTDSKESWVLYGNGSLDKLNLKDDRLYYDVLNGAVKRPWVGSLSKVGNSICFGGSGGWFEKNGNKSLTEKYPDELAGKHVTCISATNTEKLIGTQDGMFVESKGKVKRLGFGDGLSDVWITSLVQHGETVLVGTYVGGLYRYERNKLTSVETPSKKVRSLTLWEDTMVLGALDGAWIQKGETWIPLTKGETTFLEIVGNQLLVGTPAGVCAFSR